MIYKNITDLIGNTPLLSLTRFTHHHNLKANIIAKLERANPAGSVKDRLALAVIRDAEARGILTPQSVIIEATSGNTGIGLAAIAAASGYRLILTMPENMSKERQNLLTAYGAKLVLTQKEKGMPGAVAKAVEIAATTPNAVLTSQFANPANPAIHATTTGPEIWADTQGNIDAFVAGVGTGGTITGAGGFLKQKNPNLHIVAVEPAASPVLSGGKPGPHQIQGIGAGFIPDVLDTAIYNEIMTIQISDAISAARQLAKTEGLLVGISSGAAAWASVKLAHRPEFNNKNIIIILPDTGERYLSTELFT
ncbi:MAG: cysteine synthase A [Defluviitaleaceae bacterium]|nr:cysteine synthase A [Defluviitaleaceae bacterium]